MWEEKILKEIVIIKWCALYMTACSWGVAVYFLFKEIPKWWHSFDKKKNNLDKLSKGTYEGGHY
jgi:hypothetical protein